MSTDKNTDKNTPKSTDKKRIILSPKRLEEVRRQVESMLTSVTFRSCRPFAQSQMVVNVIKNVAKVS